MSLDVFDVVVEPNRRRILDARRAGDQLRHGMPCDIVDERRADAEVTVSFWPAQVAKHRLERTSS